MGRAPQEVPSAGVTSVSMIAGHGGDSTGGDIPHVSLFTEEGIRIGQYHPKKGKKLDAGSTSEEPIVIEHKQIGGRQADPYYVMLSVSGKDAVCLAIVSVSNAAVSATFFGDTGMKCGQSWFLSDKKLGTNFVKPKCAWLDADHTNGINARALSFHLNDMAPVAEKIEQYNARLETLCQSTPRFSFWKNLMPDGQIPFFDPPLQYLLSADEQSEGADQDPDRVIDKPGQYNKDIFMSQDEKPPKLTRSPRQRLQARGSNTDPEHLITTHDPQDDVREVCEHPNSYGWDILSTAQKLYCDMENKQLYELCDGQAVTDNCFDMQNKSIIPKGGIHARDDVLKATPVKAYTSEAEWQA